MRENLRMGSLLTRRKFSITFHRAKPDMNNARRVKKHELEM